MRWWLLRLHRMRFGWSRPAASTASNTAEELGSKCGRVSRQDQDHSLHCQRPSSSCSISLDTYLGLGIGHLLSFEVHLILLALLTALDSCGFPFRFFSLHPVHDDKRRTYEGLEWKGCTVHTWGCEVDRLALRRSESRSCVDSASTPFGETCMIKMKNRHGPRVGTVFYTGTGVGLELARMAPVVHFM